MGSLRIQLRRAVQHIEAAEPAAEQHGPGAVAGDPGGTRGRGPLRWRFRWAPVKKRILAKICTPVGCAGGPLLHRDHNNEWTLVGILSGGGVDCAEYEKTGQITDFTSEWTKIATEKVHNWIEDFEVFGNIL